MSSSAMALRLSPASFWKTTMSSTRFKNSGRKRRLSSPIARLLISFAGKARLARGAKAHTCVLRNLASAHVGGHDDHRVAEIDRLALAISEASFIKHLQEDVEDIWMRLLNLVEEHHRVGMPGAPALVSWPPSSCPTYPGGLPMSLDTSYSLENSLMSNEMSASLLPNRYSASVLASSVLPRARGTQEDEGAAGTTRGL